MSIGETKRAEFLIPVILDFLLIMPGRKSGYGAYPFSPSPVFSSWSLKLRCRYIFAIIFLIFSNAPGSTEYSTIHCLVTFRINHIIFM